MGDRRPRLRLGEPVRTTVLTTVGTSVVALALTLAGTPRFMVNDDLAMEGFVSGDFTGSPSPYLVFSSAVIGLPLSLAYRLSSAVPWYSFGLVATQICAIAAVGAVAWRRRSHLGPVRTAMVAAALVLAAPTQFLSLSFTSTALSLGTASVVLLLAPASSSTRIAGTAFVTGVVGLGVVAAMRFDALLAVGAVFAPTVVLAGWRSPRRLVGACTIGLVGWLGVIGLVDRSMNSRGGWPAFAEFNDVRGSLHGTAGLSELTASMTESSELADLEQAGWTHDDLLLFDAWFFDDASVYDVERLEALRDLIGARDHRRDLGTSLSLVVDGREWMVGAILLAALLALWAADRRGRHFVVLQLVWAFGVFVATASTQRFPDRIAVSLLTGLAVIVVLGPHLAGADRTVGTPHRYGDLGHPLPGIATVGIVSAALLHSLGGLGGSYSVDGLDEVALDRRATARSHLSILNGVNPAGRFVYAGAYVMIEGAPPYGRPGIFESESLLGVGWPTFSPLYEARRESMGLTGNLLEQLAAQEDLYLVIGSTLIPVLERTYERRLGVRVQMERLAELGNGGVVVQVRPAPVSGGA